MIPKQVCEWLVQDNIKQKTYALHLLSVQTFKRPSCCSIHGKGKWSPSVMSDSLWPHEPTRLLHPWDFPGKSTWMGCHFLLQGIFLTQGSNPDLPHCRQTLYHLSYQGSPAHKGKALIKFLLLLKPSHFLYFTKYLLCTRRSRNRFISTCWLWPTLLWTHLQCSCFCSLFVFWAVDPLLLI